MTKGRSAVTHLRVPSCPLWLALFACARSRIGLFDPQVFPLFIDQSLGLVVHQNLIGPWPDKAFGGPFAGCVDAHLGAEVGKASGMVEGIDGPQRELDIPFRID